MTFDDAFDRVIGHEGGYVNNPADPGGETKFGISKRAYPKVDIKNMTLEGAKDIYRRDYWLAAQCDQYDGAIGFQLFDMAVNSGLSAAAKTLQKAVGVAADGIIGAKTLAAIKAMPVSVVVIGFNAERLAYLTSLGAWKDFGKGWANRIVGNLRYAAGDI